MRVSRSHLPSTRTPCAEATQSLRTWTHARALANWSFALVPPRPSSPFLAPPRPSSSLLGVSPFSTAWPWHGDGVAPAWRATAWRLHGNGMAYGDGMATRIFPACLSIASLSSSFLYFSLSLSLFFAFLFSSSLSFSRCPYYFPFLHHFGILET